MDKERQILDATNFWQDSSTIGEPIDVLSFASVFFRRWPFLLASGILGFAVMYGISYLITPQFTSHAVFLPPSQPTMSTDSPLALFLRPPSTSVYTGLLGSEAVLDDVVQHTNLLSIYKSRDLEQARNTLRGATAISSDAAGFVTLQVTDKDPRLAQAIAANYLQALSRLNDRLAISEAAQHRQIFQKEFEKAKNELERSEVELKKAQESSGVISPETQIRSGLSAIDTARADIRAKKVALAALLRSETEQGPEVQRLQSEIAAEQAQLGSLENANGNAPGSGLSASTAPSVSLRFVQLEREVKYNQVLFDVMAKQYENARLQETSAAPGVQVVDPPELPLHKSKPTRSVMAIVGFVAGFFCAVVLVFVRNRLEVMRNDPERARSLDKLSSALRSASLRP